VGSITRNCRADVHSGDVLLLNDGLIVLVVDKVGQTD
jgi:pyruvate kinase